MAEIKLWILTVCAAAVFVTVLKYFIHSEKSFSVIKMVFALYILITVFSKASLADISQDSLNTPMPIAMQALDTDALVAENAAHALKAKLNTKLSESGIDAQCKKIVLSEDLSQVVQVKLELSDKTELSAANDTVAELFGSNVCVTE
ncbi:MAG: hypothetical protein RR754_03060 [Oscillospiraceae bacterium]